MKAAAPNFKPVELFDFHTQTNQPPICPECGKTLAWRQTEAGTIGVSWAVALDPLPAGRTGDYVPTERGTIRLRTAGDSQNPQLVTFSPHARSCTRTPF